MEKQRKAEKKAKIENYIVKIEVIEYWLGAIKLNQSRTYFHEVKFYEDEMGDEIWYHFKAYRKAFRELGYKLKKNNGKKYGCDWYIKF